MFNRHRKRPGAPPQIVAGQLPLYAGQLPLYAGRLPLYAGRLPLYAGRLPLYAGRLPLVAVAAVQALAAALAFFAFAGSAAAEPSWPTYHRDAGRSGYDSEPGEPLPPSRAWQSPSLGAPIWGEPLVLGSRVYVATVGDGIYALDAATGAVIWSKGAGAPVPSSELPCGDIQPTVGIVGTPVIDPATETIYAVADTWDDAGNEAHHVLVGYHLADGSPVAGLPIPVDPPESEPKALLQRTALNLDGGYVVFGFGGNDGDCASYKGTVVAAPQAGGQPLFWSVPIAAPATSGGAVWGVSGPAVDPSGSIYASSGNPDPPSGQQASSYDYSDSLVKLGLQSLVAEPAGEPSPLGFFEPPDWQSASNNDLDLGSAGPELLPGGMLFQAGKTGIGYLIEEAGMEAVYEHQVCGGGGSFGGDAYASGVIYVACNGGVEALSFNEAARSFSRLWQGPKDASGPPILAGGYVWVVATVGHGGEGETLYGLDPLTGAAAVTEMLPSAVVDHFGSPSAAGGQLYVATGSTVTAYAIASAPTAPAASAPGSQKGPAEGGPAPAASSVPPAKRHATPAPLRLRRRRLSVGRAGRVTLPLRCLLASGRCEGRVVLRATREKNGRLLSRRRVAHVLLGSVRVRRRAGAFTIAMRLDAHARTLVDRHDGRLAAEALMQAHGYSGRHETCVLRRRAHVR